MKLLRKLALYIIRHDASALGYVLLSRQELSRQLADNYAKGWKSGHEVGLSQGKAIAHIQALATMRQPRAKNGRYVRKQN